METKRVTQEQILRIKESPECPHTHKPATVVMIESPGHYFPEVVCSECHWDASPTYNPLL